MIKGNLLLMFSAVTITIAACSLPNQRLVNTELPFSGQENASSPSPELETETALDRSKPESIVAWMAFRIESRDYAALHELVNGSGAKFVRAGVDFSYVNNDNGFEFAQQLADASGSSAPICAGYKTSGTNDTLQKLWVVFSGLHLNQASTGLDHTNKIVSFLFVRNNDLWELVVVVPENDPTYILTNLKSCH